MREVEREIDLGNIEVGGWVKARQWLGIISRYKSVRFYGFVRGRFFVGMIFGSNEQSKLDAYSEEICRLNIRIDELTKEARG